MSHFVNFCSLFFQVALHPSILPADFDITPSGELVLNLPQGAGDSNNSSPENNFSTGEANAGQLQQQAQNGFRSSGTAGVGTSSFKDGDLPPPPLVHPNQMVSSSVHAFIVSNCTSQYVLCWRSSTEGPMLARNSSIPRWGIPKLGSCWSCDFLLRGRRFANSTIGPPQPDGESVWWILLWFQVYVMLTLLD